MDTSDVETMKDIGCIFDKLGDLNSARQWHEKALEIDTAMRLLNILLNDEEGELKEVDFFQKTIQSDPKLIQHTAEQLRVY